MAMTDQQRADAYKFFIVTFGAVPGVEYMNQINDAYSNGSSTQEIVNIYTGKSQFKNLYPDYLSNEQFATKLIENVVGESASAEAKAAAVADVVGALNSGISKGDVVYTLFENLSNKPADSASWGKTATMLSNKAEVAKFFTEDVLVASKDLSELGGLIANVTNDRATVQAAKDGQADTNKTFTLTTGQDNLAGTTGNDTFIANIAQNVNGEQTNTLGTGDTLKGGAGTDTLKATVQAASALNAGPSTAIRPSTNSVENIEITALGGARNWQAVTVDAAELKGVNKIGSVQSNTDLTIYNMTTRTNNSGDGVKDEDYSNRKVTESVTIVYDHSAPTNTSTGAADLTVLFDNDYLVCGADLTSQAHFYLLDQDAELQIQTGQRPNKWPDRELNDDQRLADINVNGLRFSVDDMEYAIEMTDEQRVEATTHEAYVAVLQTVLAEKQAAGEIPADITLSLDYSNPRTNVALEGGLIARPVPAFVLNSSSSVVKYIGFVNSSNAPGDFDVYGRGGQAVESECRVTSTIELEKVGRDGDGGVLTVGGMAGDGLNVWSGTQHSQNQGVEVFNITVKGDATQNSSLAALKSTNNTLQEVNIKSAAGSKADLYIGNANTATSTVDGIALKDVKTFNATEFANNLSLNATLTDEVVAKYFNLTDAHSSPLAGDNVTFAYNLGGGNDTLNLDISNSNLNYEGTTTREDFVLKVNSGAGNDKITVNITGDQGGANWYQNSKQNARLEINAGAGDDTVTTTGGGYFQVEAGAGDDAVYLNNNTAKAVWVFGARNGENTNNDLGSAIVGNAFSVRVTFSGGSNAGAGVIAPDANPFVNGFEKVASVPNYNSATLTATAVSTQQLVKEAINKDPVLSKLLVAKDGPANTVVIESLVAGAFSADDIRIEVDGLNGGVYVNSNAQLVTAGTDAAIDSDNLVIIGSGNDVTVLSTHADSKDIIKFAGYDNGRDTIVNFDASGGIGGDQLNFSNYLATKVNGVLVPVTVNIDAVAEANSVTGLVFDSNNGDFKALTADKLLSQLNGEINDPNHGGIVDATLDAQVIVNPDGGVRDHIVMVENSANRGEYKVFHLTSREGDVAGRFDTAKEITTADFGASLAAGGPGAYLALNNAVNGGTGGETGIAPLPPVVGDRTIIAEDGQTYIETDATNTTYVIPTNSANFTISGFQAGDKLDFGDAANPTVINTSFNDGLVVLQWAASPTQIVQVTVDGEFDFATDLLLSGINGWNQVFGEDTII